MALSYNETVASGSTDIVNVPFGYLDKSHVHVSLNGTPVDDATLTWNSPSQIELASVPVDGVKVRAYRVTPTAPLITFEPGNLDPADLNNGNLQGLYLTQETSDYAAEVEVALNDSVARIDDDMDAIGTRIDGIDGTVATAATAVAIAQAAIATAQAAIATAQAATAASSASAGAATLTATQAVKAEADAVLAAYLTTAGAYGTIALGLDLVADNVNFLVQPNATDGLTRYTAYKRLTSTTQQLIASFSTGAEVDAIHGTRTIGRPISATLTTGTGLPDKTYVYATPAAFSGRLKRVRAYALTGGVVSFKRMTRSGNTFTQIGLSVRLAVSTGLNTFSFSAADGIYIRAGEYLAVTSQNLVLSYVIATGDEGGIYESPSTGGETSPFTDADGLPSTTPVLQIGFDFDAGETIDLAMANTGITDANLPFVIGRGLAPASGAATAGDFVFAPAKPAPYALQATRLHVRMASSGSLVLKRLVRVGATFTQVGSDVTLSVASGLNVFGATDLASMQLAGGEYLGLYGSFRYSAVTADDGGFFNAASSGNLSVWTDANGAPATTVRLEVGVEFVPLGRDPVLTQRVAVLEAAVGTTGAIADVGLGDAISAATLTPTALSIVTTATLVRRGSAIPLSDTRTLTAPSGSNVRYDLLHYSPEAGTWAVAAGTERLTDPTAFLPAAPSGALPVFMMRVTASSVTAVPVWQVYDGNVRSIEPQIDLERRRSRLLLPKTIGKIRRMASLRLLGFGDSITAIQRATPSATAINGADRDRATAPLSDTYHFLRDGYGTDVVDALPLYTAVQLGRTNDGAGTVHSRIGWNWTLVRELERVGYTLGTDLWYDNLGVGGWATSDAISGVTPTSWLSTALGLSPSPDLVVLSLGMNELGNTGTKARMVSIIQAFQAQHIEVLVVGVPRPRSGTLEDWQYTERALRRAAEYTGAAYLSSLQLFDDRYIQAVGIATADVSASNANNHPGMVELEAIGMALVRLLIGT